MQCVCHFNFLFLLRGNSLVLFYSLFFGVVGQGTKWLCKDFGYFSLHTFSFSSCFFSFCYSFLFFFWFLLLFLLFFFLFFFYIIFFSFFIFFFFSRVCVFWPAFTSFIAITFNNMNKQRKKTVLFYINLLLFFPLVKWVALVTNCVTVYLSF